MEEIIRKAIANETYQILGFDECGCVDESEYPEIEIDQYKDDQLELWKTRGSDGFHFVYCNRLKIGYWVNPNLITEV